VKATREREVVS